MGRETQKDEIIQLHSFLCQLRTHLEAQIGEVDTDVFSAYESIGVSPQHVFKSKKEHKRAVFALSRGIADLLSLNRWSGSI